MASEFTEEFKKLWNNEKVNPSMGVGLMIWASGKHSNIHNMNIVNTHLKWVDRNIFIAELSLLNTMRTFLRSPSVGVKEKEVDFFLDDICEYYGWSRRELELNRGVLDFDFLREEIPLAFAYDKKMRTRVNKFVRELDGGKKEKR